MQCLDTITGFQEWMALVQKLIPRLPGLEIKEICDLNREDSRTGGASVSRISNARARRLDRTMHRI